MTYSEIELEPRERIACITLNRPDRANAVNRELARDLFDAAVRCDQSSEVRAVVIAGAGENSCAVD